MGVAVPGAAGACAGEKDGGRVSRTLVSIRSKLSACDCCNDAIMAVRSLAVIDAVASVPGVRRLVDLGVAVSSSGSTSKNSV